MGENEVTVQYPNDGNYPSLMPNRVPARALKFAEVPRFRGKSRAWNQFGKAKTVASFCTRVSDTELTISYSTSGTAYAQASESFSTVLGHKYLVYIKGDSGCKVRTSSEGIMPYINDVATGYLGIREGDGGNASYLSLVSTDTSGSGTVRFLVRDLTLILSDWSASDITTANIPLMVQQIPDLLKYDAYDAGSLVDTEVSGVEAIGFNIWNEQIKNGYYDTADGSFVANNSWRASDDYIPCKPSTTYYGMLDSGVSATGYIFLFYDATKNYIRWQGSEIKNGTFTTPSNCYYMTFYIGPAYTEHPMCINLSGSKNGTYEPYKTDTLSLPETVTLRSAGSVAEVLTLETGKKTRPIGSVDLGSLNYTYGNVDGAYCFLTQAGGAGIKDPGIYYIPNIVCSKYKSESWVNNRTSTSYDKTIAILNRDISIQDSGYSDPATFKASMSGVYLNYELATPLSDEQVCDPIPYNFIEVEGGGTIETIQTQTPVLDNCLDVTYDIIPQ